MKKNILLFVALLLTAFVVNAQDNKNPKDENAGDEKPKEEKMQTLLGGKQSVGFFGALEFRGSEVRNQSALLAGARLGVIFNHRFSIGLGGYGIASDPQWRNNAGFDRSLAGGYGGLAMEYTILPLKAVHLSVPLLLGAGGVAVFDGSWNNNNWNGPYEIENSAFFVVEPGVLLEFNVAKFFRIGLGGHYRFVSAASLNEISNKQLSNWSGSLCLKFGKF